MFKDIFSLSFNGTNYFILLFPYGYIHFYLNKMNFFETLFYYYYYSIALTVIY